MAPLYCSLNWTSHSRETVENTAHLSQLTPALHQDPTSKAWRYNQILLILKSTHKVQTLWDAERKLPDVWVHADCEFGNP